jgi:AcrR family transcriptional regulator
VDVASTRRGRRPGSPDTRAAILAEARGLFAAKGYAGTSVRAVASAAGVDASLVHHYFGTKDDLFLAALHVPIDPREVLVPVAAGGIDGAGERLLRTFLTVWDDEATRLPLLTLVRSVFDPEGHRLVRDGFMRMVLGPVAAALAAVGVEDAELRMSLVASQLMGIVLARYVVGVEPLVTASADQLVAVYAPTLQRYLDGPLG